MHVEINCPCFTETAQGRLLAAAGCLSNPGCKIDLSFDFPANSQTNPVCLVPQGAARFLFRRGQQALKRRAWTGQWDDNRGAKFGEIWSSIDGEWQFFVVQFDLDSSPPSVAEEIVQEVMMAQQLANAAA
jgi:hypothetical protein